MDSEQGSRRELDSFWHVNGFLGGRKIMARGFIFGRPAEKYQFTSAGSRPRLDSDVTGFSFGAGRTFIWRAEFLADRQEIWPARGKVLSLLLAASRASRKQRQDFHLARAEEKSCRASWPAGQPQPRPGTLNSLAFP